MPSTKNQKRNTARVSSYQRERVVKPSRARRGTLYELFILGELNTGPHHGYLLREILSKILGPFRQVSWGALYPLIHRLEEQGLITLDTRSMAAAQRRGEREQRNLYQITREGKARFMELILEPVPFASYETDLFIAKLGYFDYLTTAQQQDILRHHQNYLRAQSEFIQKMLRYVLGEEEIPKSERERIEWVTNFRLRRIQIEMDWVEEQLAALRE